MPSEMRFGAVRRMLEKAGYRLVRIAGSHHIFEKPGNTILSIPVHKGKVKPFYVRQIQRIIQESQEE
jgi:predicted RNA binding protein YcfA (HicA-like mRNA interferase family)